MKHLFFFVTTLILFTSCKKNKDTILPKEDNEYATKAGRTIEVFNNEAQFTSVLSKSAERTFGTNIKFKLDRIDNIEINNKLVSMVFYNTEKGQSTVLIVTDLTTYKKTVVDCTGTCDCRERLIIKPDGTQIYECTCNECKMTVEQV